MHRPLAASALPLSSDEGCGLTDGIMPRWSDLAGLFRALVEWRHVKILACGHLGACRIRPGSWSSRFAVVLLLASALYRRRRYTPRGVWLLLFSWHCRHPLCQLGSWQ